MTTDTQLLPEEPLDVLGTRLAEDGAVSEFLYTGASGLWRLRLRDGGWEDPVLVAREPGYDGYRNYPPVWNGRYLAFRHEDDSLCVVPLDGRAPITIDDREGGLCFLPDGERLLVVDGEEARIHDLREPGGSVCHIDAFHKFKFPYYDDVDDPGWLSFVKDRTGGHHLAAGCYGYFACWPVRLGADGLPEPAGPPVTLVDPFAYDHVRICAVGPAGAVWVNDVSGNGLVRFEAETGEHAEAPVGRNSEHAICHGVLPSPESAAAWVRTKDKAAIWRPDGGWLSLPDQAISAVAFRGNALWCTVLGGEMLSRLDVSGLPPPAKAPNRR